MAQHLSGIELGCALCSEALEHCHGTAIVHLDLLVSCSDDPECRLAAEVHRFEIACDEPECGAPALDEASLSARTA